MEIALGIILLALNFLWELVRNPFFWIIIILLVINLDMGSSVRSLRDDLRDIKTILNGISGRLEK